MKPVLHQSSVINSNVESSELANGTTNESSTPTTKLSCSIEVPLTQKDEEERSRTHPGAYSGDGDDGDDDDCEEASACIEGTDKVCFSKDKNCVTTESGNRAHKPSKVHDDVLNSVNNLRLNVNNRIIGKMRKISITELNRRSRSSKHARFYRIAFYIAITLLSFLFLYLIYQNLFND